MIVAESRGLLTPSAGDISVQTEKFKYKCYFPVTTIRNPGDGTLIQNTTSTLYQVYPDSILTPIHGPKYPPGYITPRPTGNRGSGAIEKV